VGSESGSFGSYQTASCSALFLSYSKSKHLSKRKKKKKKKIIVNNVCQQCGESIPFVIQMGTGCNLTSMLDFSM
jgi:hypothetical protein